MQYKVRESCEENRETEGKTIKEV